MVNVLQDGWGDLMNCLNAVRIVKKEYPKWTMRILILILNRAPIPFNLEEYGLNPSEYLAIHEVDKQECFTKEFKILSSRLRGGACVDTDTAWLPQTTVEIKIDSFIKFFKTSDLQIAVSTPPWFTHSDINHVGPKFIQFFEYGRVPERYMLPNIYAMGLSPSSCGIFILNQDIQKNFENPILHKYFNREEKVYFNYGSSIERYTTLVSHLNPEAIELNIVTNSSIKEIKKMNFEHLDKVTFVDKTGVEIELWSAFNPLFFLTYFNPLPFHSGKMLRFINPFPLGHDDMLRAIKMSHEPVGITGNNTFSESLDKLPFYNNRACLQNFWSQLIQLAKNATPQNIILIDYLEQLSYQKDKSKKILIDPQDLPPLKKQWGELIEIIRRDWNVNDSYLGEINSRIVLKHIATS